VDIELVWDAHADTGEGPIWEAGSRRLFWVDVTGRLVHVLEPAGDLTRTYAAGQDVGAAASRASGGLVLALGRGFALLDLDSGEIETIAEPEAGNPQNRMNDGKCDSGGRFWAGSMAYSEQGREGSLYRLEPDHTVARVLSGVGLSNGMGWSPDDRLMYYIDSLAAGVDVYEFDAASGALSNGRRLITVPPSQGVPDGMTVDEEGSLWVAFWNGGAVRRYRPDGSLVQEVELPPRQVSSCAFGGADLGDLYITTAARGLSAEELDQQPGAGGLFRCRPGVKGLPAHAFLG
jgi:sugar lactone lactonase YvrE